MGPKLIKMGCNVDGRPYLRDHFFDKFAMLLKGNLVGDDLAVIGRWKDRGSMLSRRSNDR
ncbi:hypothetical protein PBR20603_01143 [Pandoraea bronchicola]|uniref:Uncharacterized protein n=1 Tax=Pandoraea bronchicola TaxID=2508287 RepID=A0A5E5BPJ1_9BURK|nr:hypothetical protein PBR20603_01143 [Pandoraea bronchicola]